MRTLTCLLASLLLAPAALAQDAGAPAPAEAAPAPKTAADYDARLDALYKTRDNAESMKETDKLISESTKAFPKDYGILWRAARYRWWQADGTKAEKLRTVLAKEAWNWAKQAHEVNPNGFEAKYFTAISIGAYSQAVGILKALGEGLEGKFNENLDSVVKSNPSYENYGPLTSKGRYYYELPWPKRDLGKSKELLEKVVKNAPQHLRGWYYLAATQLKDGDAKAAKVSIDKALNGDVSYDPPEGRRVKGWAKDLAKQIDDELK